MVLWVSTASAALLSAVGGGPGGADGDFAIRLAVKDKNGKVVTQTSVEVNRPVEVLYAVDGTSTRAADNANVRLFQQFVYRGVDGTDKFYWDGPQAVINGTDSPNIVTNVENRIQADYATALQLHRRLVIDMVGWSRGAVIIATVARDLDTVGFAINGATYQHIVKCFNGSETVRALG